MGVGGKFADITRSDLLPLADRYAIGPAPKIIDKVLDAVADWPTFAEQSGLARDTVQSIAADFRAF
jgi:serine/threonine-protein kinase HipA